MSHVKREAAKSVMDHFLTVIIFIFTFTFCDPIGKFPHFEGLLVSYYIHFYLCSIKYNHLLVRNLLV